MLKMAKQTEKRIRPLEEERDRKNGKKDRTFSVGTKLQLEKDQVLAKKKCGPFCSFCCPFHAPT